MKKNYPDSMLKECEYCYKMVKELTEIEPETNGWAICNACLKKHFSEYHVTSCKEDYADNYFQRLSVTRGRYLPIGCHLKPSED